MLPSLSTITLISIAALSHGSPFQLSSRQYDFGGDGGDIASLPEYVGLGTTEPVCGSDSALKAIAHNETQVDVKKDCDPVINHICNHVAGSPPTSVNYKSGNCQGYILVTPNYPAIDYSACVAKFQAITTTCMLVNDPTVTGGNKAKEGQQFGVLNIKHSWPQSDRSPAWERNSDQPGYMMGPPTVFGSYVGMGEEIV
ncbi:MAG: hypothetical protein LQ349_008714 [Xanthoria aureola]|nr:MAG: hypothetical protein LQ349_008714 [Xanthoria aureola]